MLKNLGLDGLVLTAKTIPATVSFYTSLLGRQTHTFGEGGVALTYQFPRNGARNLNQQL